MNTNDAFSADEDSLLASEPGDDDVVSMASVGSLDDGDDNENNDDDNDDGSDAADNIDDESYRQKQCSDRRYSATVVYAHEREKTVTS